MDSDGENEGLRHKSRHKTPAKPRSEPGPLPEERPHAMRPNWRGLEVRFRELSKSPGGPWLIATFDRGKAKAEAINPPHPYQLDLAERQELLRRFTVLATAAALAAG